jgi:hypothetical protein
MKFMIYKAFFSIFIFLSLSGLPFLDGLSLASTAQPSALSYDLVWTEPINLSHSGSTSNPQLIIDYTGRFYAFWVDQFDGYVTANSYDGNNWSKPVPVNFPFSIKDGPPVLVTDSAGYIHAFWTDPTNALFYSRVFADNFSSGESWEASQELAASALDFNVTVDNNGIIHLAYVRILSTDEAPSGIYYRVSKDSGANWDASQVLYQSQYFRSLKPEEANVKLSASGDGSIYVVWDNPLLKLILFTNSIGGEHSWTEPKVLKGPDVEDGNNIPFGGNIAVNGNGILITWQSGQADAYCDQYSQWSTDTGYSWSTPLLISQSKYGCSPETKLFTLQDGLILLRTNMENQPALLAWNGSEWSDRQSILTSFTDPETYDSINYRVQQTILAGSTQLYVIGYDDGGIGDTWLTSRSLESILDWFPNPSNWSTPELLYSTPTEISSVSIAVDEKDQFHVLWIQRDQNNGKEISSIYYSKWDGSVWTQPQSIYATTQGDVSHLDAAVDRERLLVVWSEGLNDQILFSWSSPDKAQNPSEWSTPLQLSTTRFTGESPKILADNSGIVYVAYSKTINEERGIYMVKSIDEGRNWSDPSQLFNAEAAGWDIADSPELATDQNGAVNVIWAKKSFPEDGHLLGLYTSVSGDQGSTWSNPIIVEEGDLTWSQISGIHSSNLYRIWQEVDISSQLVNWNQVSIDGGVTWSLPTSVTDPEDNIGSPIATTDTAGRLYLFQPIQVTPQITGITNRIWSTDRWLVEDRIILDNHDGFIPGSLAAAISPSGSLILVFIEKVIDASTGHVNYSLAYASRMVEIPAVIPTPEPPVRIEPTQTSIATTIPSASQTLTDTLPINQDGANNSSQVSTNHSIIGLILGSSLVAVISAIFIVYYVISRKRVK